MNNLLEKKATDLTAEELEALLAEKKAKEREQRLKARSDYEQHRDKVVAAIMRDAKEHEQKLKEFKHAVLVILENHRIKANEYGDIRSNSKGGFGIRHSQTGEMVQLVRNSLPEYDERAGQAEQLLKEFLEDKVKRRDVATYRTIDALMSRNKKGDFTPARIASLLKIKDNYDDPRWNKAMELFEESFNVREISYSVSFFRKDAMGKDVPIVLSMSGIDVDELLTHSQKSTETL